MAQLLSDTISRKYTETIGLGDEWEIETDTGWQDIHSISRTIPYQKWYLETSSGKFLECADDHIIFDHNDNEIFVKNCVPFHTKIKTEDGDEFVTKCHASDVEEEMYDMDVEGERFYSNGILSHNSTTMLSYILHYILFNADVSVAILANKGSLARDLLSRLCLSYEKLPKWLQQGVTIWNKGNIALENGSKVMAASTSSSAVRGGSYNVILLDEFAHVEDHVALPFFTSVFPTISSGKTTKVLMASTPNGMNLFYKLWCDAIEKKSSYVPIEVNWRDIPGRDNEWKAQQIANSSESQFAQEYCCEFLGSSSTLISTERLKQLSFIKPLVNKDGLAVYAYPEVGHIYNICVDVSRGVGLDNSAFVVTDITTMPYKMVARYMSNDISPLLFPTIISHIGTRYNNASVLVEINDVGQQVSDILQFEIEYDNLLTTRIKSKRQVVSGGFSKNIQYGLRMTNVTKNIGCGTLKSLIENNKLIIEDEETIKELYSFIASNVSFAAEAGKHDDIVMAYVSFGWLVNQRYFKETTDRDIRTQIYGTEIKSIDEEDQYPLPIYDTSDLNNEQFIDSEGTVWTPVSSDDRIFM